MDKHQKIDVIYSNGELDCQNVVADTYRKALSFMGLKGGKSIGSEDKLNQHRKYS